MQHQTFYTICVILELSAFLAGSANVINETGSDKENVAKRSSEPSTWTCHAGCRKFCLPSCKRSCCATAAKPYHEGMFQDLLNYQDTLPPPPQPPVMPAGMSGSSAAGQCAQGCPQSCAPSCQTQCCSGSQMSAPGGQQPIPYQQPYGYPQQGYPQTGYPQQGYPQQQQQAGRNYQTGLATGSSPQHGQSYAQGLAGNAVYQDASDMYNVHIPSAFERLKALRKTSPRYKPVINKAKPKPKVKPKRYRHRFYDKNGNPHDEIVYDGARCDTSCHKLCEPSCRFECCVEPSPRKQKAVRKVKEHQKPIPTLVRPVQNDGKLTYPYADTTPPPDNSAAQSQPPADPSAGAPPESAGVPPESANVQPESTSSQPEQPAQGGVPEENSDFAATPFGFGANQRPGAYQSQYGGHQGMYGAPPGQYGRYPGALGGYQGIPGGYTGTQHNVYPHTRHGTHQRHSGPAAGYPPTGQYGYQASQQYPQQYPQQTTNYPAQQPGNPGYTGVQQGAPAGPTAPYGLSQTEQQCPAPCPQTCAPSCSQQCCNPPPPPMQACGGGCASSCAPACAPKCCWDRKRNKIPRRS